MATAFPLIDWTIASMELFTLRIEVAILGFGIK